MPDKKPMEKWQLIFSKISRVLSVTDQKNRDELSFLPAVIEIQEAPPSPVGRTTAWLIMIFFAIAIIWAMIGEIEIVAVAHGKIIPSGHSKIIQPIETAIVKAIYVHDDQQVKAGDILLELDTTLTQADFEDVSQQRVELQAEHQRLTYLLNLLEAEKTQQTDVFKQAKEKLSVFQLNILKNQYNEYLQTIKVLQSTYYQKQAGLRASKSTISKLEQTLPIVTKRFESIEKIYMQKLASEQQYLESKQQLIEQRQDLETQRNISQSVHQELYQIEAQNKQYKYEFKSTVMQNISEIQSRIKSLDQQVIKTGKRNTSQLLKSPINGTVQQLVTNTIGGVVTPAQALMVIVPDNDKLQVEAFLQNKDIGFVEENQIAEIKVDAFPFTKYGVIEGSVISVSSDAVEHEQLGLVFTMKANMNKSIINVNGKKVKLSPGMSVSVEIKTGRRKIIDYIVRPVSEVLDSSIKER